MIRRRQRIAGALIGFLLLAGCGTVVDPELSPDSRKLSTYDADPTLPHAIEVATSLRDQYAGKVDQQILLTRSVGLALIPAAAVAVGLGATGHGADAVLGIALGGAAAFTAATFLTSRQQQHIYAAGANAVQCALDAMQPLRVAYSDLDRLKLLLLGTAAGPEIDLMEPYNTLIAKVSAELSGVPEGIRAPIVLRAEQAIAEATAMQKSGMEAVVILEGAGGELMASVNSIQGEIRAAIIDASSDLSALVESLGQTLPALGGRITGVPVAFVPEPAKPQEFSSALDALVPELEARTEEIALIVAKVNAKPSVEDLKNCEVDLTEVGLDFSVVPAGVVPVTAGSAATVVTLQARGGVLPYRAKWVGQVPPAGYELLVESGLGVITVTVPAGAAEAKYTLLVQDAGQGQEAVILAVSGAPAESLERQAPATDPVVQAVQSCLLEQGIRQVEVGGETKLLEADGRWGDITEEAIRRYLESAGGVPREDQPQDQAGLLSDLKTVAPAEGACASLP